MDTFEVTISLCNNTTVEKNRELEFKFFREINSDKIYFYKKKNLIEITLEQLHNGSEIKIFWSGWCCTSSFLMY